jgi:hypothetical protein
MPKEWNADCPSAVVAVQKGVVFIARDILIAVRTGANLPVSVICCRIATIITVEKRVVTSLRDMLVTIVTVPLFLDLTISLWLRKDQKLVITEARNHLVPIVAA